MELKMTIKEATRYSIMRNIKDKKINLKQAAKQLGLSYKQTTRIWGRYKREGPEGLISKRRGKPSSNRLTNAIVDKAVFLIKKKYMDYGPTLVSEKLDKKHNLKISKESLRKIMISEGIWEPKKTKEKRVYARRTRRSRYGDLEQIDGSYHHWFEDRGEKCCLLVSVDDATSAITGLRFCEHETTYDYLEFLKNYIKTNGKPMGFYSDKHSVFRVNNKKKTDGIFCTQFQRVLKNLDIELICAHSPQAKGRVERANKTLQDRFIKELREKVISTIKEANEYADTFILEYNQKFAKEPAINENSHRKMSSLQELEDICMIQVERTLSKDLSFQYNREIYQIDSHCVNRFGGKKVKVYELYGEVKRVLLGERVLKFKKWKEKISEPAKIIGVKEMETLWPAFARKPKRNHPWR